MEHAADPATFIGPALKTAMQVYYDKDCDLDIIKGT
jgi:hypothetical protein